MQSLYCSIDLCKENSTAAARVRNVSGFGDVDVNNIGHSIILEIQYCGHQMKFRLTRNVALSQQRF